MREAQQQVAKGLLMSVLTLGQHHLAGPEEWSDELPAAVLGAVRNAKQITPDRTMANLRNPGHPCRRAPQGSATSSTSGEFQGFPSARTVRPGIAGGRLC